MTAALKNLKVLNDYIIIKPFQEPEENVTDTGIVLARNPGDPSLVYHYAKVVGIGTGVNLDFSTSYPDGLALDTLKVGDVIYYAQSNAKALAVVEEGYVYDPRKANYAYIKPEDVIAVVTSDVSSE